MGRDTQASAPENDRGFYELLEELPENCRTIFLLYYGEGFHTKEIAQILEMNENTVKSRLKRGRKNLEQVFFVFSKGEKADGKIRKEISKMF